MGVACFSLRAMAFTHSDVIAKGIENLNASQNYLFKPLANEEHHLHHSNLHHPLPLHRPDHFIVTKRTLIFSFVSAQTVASSFSIQS